MSTTTVTISMVGNTIDVTPYAPVLKKTRKDKVKWQGRPANLNFVVCFGHRTPFKFRHFHKNRPNSGAILINPAGPEEYFKYSVEIGNIVLDPGIIIQR